MVGHMLKVTSRGARPEMVPETSRGVGLEHRVGRLISRGTHRPRSGGRYRDSGRALGAGPAGGHRSEARRVASRARVGVAGRRAHGGGSVAEADHDRERPRHPRGHGREAHLQGSRPRCGARRAGEGHDCLRSGYRSRRCSSEGARPRARKRQGTPVHCVSSCTLRCAHHRRADLSRDILGRGSGQEHLGHSQPPSGRRCPGRE